MTPITQYLDDMTDKGMQQGDQLKGWRVGIAHLFQKALGKAGMTPEQVVAEYKNLTRKGRKLGNYMRKNTTQFVSDLAAGNPTFYSMKDMEVLSKIINVPVGDFFEPAKLYDRYSANDHVSLNELIPDSFRTYGPFLVHKRREAIKRGLGNDFYDKKTMYFFLSLMRIHNSFSKSREARIGKILYELVDRPIGVSESGEKALSMDQIRDNISKDVKGNPVPDPDIYKYTLPQTKRYYPNPSQGDPDAVKNQFGPDVDPNSQYVRQHFEPDFDQIARRHIRDEQGNPTTLDYWKNKTMENLRQKAADPTNPKHERAKEVLQQLEQNADQWSVADQVKNFVPSKYRKPLHKDVNFRPVRGPGGLQKMDETIVRNFFKTMERLDELAEMKSSTVRFASRRQRYSVDQMVDDIADRFIDLVHGLK
jgi:hypothetical protein